MIVIRVAPVFGSGQNPAFFQNPAPGKTSPEPDAIAGCKKCTQVMPIQYFIQKFLA